MMVMMVVVVMPVLVLVIIVVMVVVVMPVLVLVIIVVMVVMVLVLVLMVMVMVMMVLVLVFVVIILIHRFFDFLNPGGGGYGTLEIEEVGIENFVEVEVAVVSLDNLRFGLEGTDDLLDMVGLLACHFRDFVEHDDVAEFNLLYHETFEILLADVGSSEIVAGAKLAFESESVDHGHDAVEPRDTVYAEVRSHHRHGAYCLGYRLRLADAAGFDYDIVEITVEKVG